MACGRARACILSAQLTIPGERHPYPDAQGHKASNSDVGIGRASTRLRVAGPRWRFWRDPNSRETAHAPCRREHASGADSGKRFLSPSALPCTMPEPRLRQPPIRQSPPATMGRNLVRQQLVSTMQLPLLPPRVQLAPLVPVMAPMAVATRRTRWRTMTNKRLRGVAVAQGLYYAITGVWPLVSLRTF